MALALQISGVTTLPKRKSHKSIPTPVMTAVTSHNNSGRCLVSKELQPIMRTASKTPQLPPVSPTLIDKPTKTASNGDVPKSDKMVKEIPRASPMIPSRKNAKFAYGFFIFVFHETDLSS